MTGATTTPAPSARSATPIAPSNGSSGSIKIVASFSFSPRRAHGSTTSARSPFQGLPPPHALPRDGQQLADLTPSALRAVKAACPRGGGPGRQGLRARLSERVSLRRELLEEGWVGLGLHVEFYAGDQWIITSHVRAIAVEPSMADAPC